MIVLIDNYDSFVHNLARYFRELGQETRVVRNDACDVAALERWSPQAIVISPGPCTPAEAGISMTVIRELGPRVPILGVCLGHQAIAAALGGRIIRAREPVHGCSSSVHHSETGLFAGVPNPMRAGRYHSLVVDVASLPEDLTITARATDGTPMAIEHARWPVWGVQFHPESVLTESGHTILRNFLNLAGVPSVGEPEGAREGNAMTGELDDWPPRGPLPITW